MHRTALFVIALLATGCEYTLRRVVDYPPARAPRALIATVDPGVQWRHGAFAQARKEARRLGRPLLVYLSTVWCGPCKRMAADTFIDARVYQAINDGLVPFKLDGDSPEGEAFRKEFKINSYPTMAFFRPDGQEIDRAFGYHNADQMVRMIDDMVHDRGTVGSMRRALEAQPDAIAMRYRLGMQLALRGETDEALSQLNEVIKQDPQDAKTYASQALYAIGRYVHMMKTIDLAAAEQALSTLVTRFPKSNAARAGSIDLCDLAMRGKHPDKALQALGTLVKADPNDPQRHLEAAMAVLRFGLDPRTGAEWAKRATTLRADGAPWAVLGALLERAGDASGRLAALEEAAKRSPSDPQIQSDLQRAKAAVPH